MHNQSQFSSILSCRFFSLLLFCLLFITKASAEPLFTIHGSNTIGARLAPALVKDYLLSKGAIDVVVIDLGNNETRVEAMMKGQGSKVSVEIAAHGSGTGFQGLKSGTADIAAASALQSAVKLKI
jgi:phosphate transport system substrate-binding protein